MAARRKKTTAGAKTRAGAKRKAGAKKRTPGTRRTTAAKRGRPARSTAKSKTARRAASSRGPSRTDLLARERARLERNKQLVLAFYEKMIGEKDPEAARRYMGERYVQHSPYAKDGFEGVAEFARSFKRDFPDHRYEVKRVIAEGDYVVLHLHGINGLSPHGEAVIDVFRVQDGKVVEHWDVIQSLPENSENPNTPF